MRVRRRHVRALNGGAVVLLAAGFAARDMPVGVIAIGVGLVVGFVGSTLALHSANKANQLWWGIAIVVMLLPAAALYCALDMPADTPLESREKPREQPGGPALQQRRRESLIALAILIPISLIVGVVVFVATESVAATLATALVLGPIGGAIYALWVRRTRGVTARE